MIATGVVRTWHDDEGWGVIDSPATPAGCWTHFSSVRVDGLATLTVGQDVTFEFESAEQDGYRFRTVGVWPTGQEPKSRTLDEAGSSSAYQSTLTLTFDEPGTV
ncbi:cold-shock protein [Nocardioides nanhaiensis]|uniref:CSD domain-containing protein n=1 Tax=Nocardioides nanhaiensis TaxID=1476871 RepID=A0ABP8WKA8_9ACTN